MTRAAAPVGPLIFPSYCPLLRRDSDDECKQLTPAVRHGRETGSGVASLRLAGGASHFDGARVNDTRLPASEARGKNWNNTRHSPGASSWALEEKGERKQTDRSSNRVIPGNGAPRSRAACFHGRPLAACQTAGALALDNRLRDSGRTRRAFQRHNRAPDARNRAHFRHPDATRLSPTGISMRKDALPPLLLRVLEPCAHTDTHTELN